MTAALRALTNLPATTFHLIATYPVAAASVVIFLAGVGLLAYRYFTRPSRTRR